MEFLNDYLIAVIMGICLCTGYIIKNIIPGKKINKFIPMIMAAIGVFLNVWINSWTINPGILLGGLASGLASTGMYEAFANFIKKGD